MIKSIIVILISLTFILTSCRDCYKNDEFKSAIDDAYDSYEFSYSADTIAKNEKLIAALDQINHFSSYTIGHEDADNLKLFAYMRIINVYVHQGDFQKAWLAYKRMDELVTWKGNQTLEDHLEDIQSFKQAYLLMPTSWQDNKTLDEKYEKFEEYIRLIEAPKE